MTIELRLCLLALLFLFGSTTSWAMPSASDEPAFTAHVAQRIRGEIPDADVAIKGVRTIDVKINGRTLTASLDNLVADCLREPSQCESLVDNYVKVVQAASRADDAPVQKADIRVVVRNADYVKELTARTLHNPERAPIVQKLAGDLWLVCVVDQPRNTVSLSRERAAKLGLTTEQAIALGKSNVKKTLPSLSAVTRELPPNGIGVLDSDFYESSRWLLHDEWAPLSKQYDGHLVVAMPAPNVVVYGDGSSAQKRAAIAALVKHVAENEQRQLSTKLFLWTKAGWNVVE